MYHVHMRKQLSSSNSTSFLVFKKKIFQKKNYRQFWIVCGNKPLRWLNCSVNKKVNGTFKMLISWNTLGLVFSLKQILNSCFTFTPRENRENHIKNEEFTTLSVNTFSTYTYSFLMSMERITAFVSRPLLNIASIYYKHPFQCTHFVNI